MAGVTKNKIRKVTSKDQIGSGAAKKATKQVEKKRKERDKRASSAAAMARRAMGIR